MTQAKTCYRRDSVTILLTLKSVQLLCHLICNTAKIRISSLLQRTVETHPFITNCAELPARGKTLQGNRFETDSPHHSHTELVYNHFHPEIISTGEKTQTKQLHFFTGQQVLTERPQHNQCTITSTLK